MEASSKPGHNLLSFINASPSPFHAVDNIKTRLKQAGFSGISEKDSWASTCRPGGKYFLTRNGTTIIAFAIGKKFQPGNAISMIGAHTDSPCLRVKPQSGKRGEGFLQVGVETYGGGLWHTWFDRDLSVAGRAMVRTDQGTIIPKLIKINRPILRIPTLAIHLERNETFSFNKETQLFPIAGLVAAELNRIGESTQETKVTEDQEYQPWKPASAAHHPYLVELVATEAGVAPSNVVDFELLLYDTQKSCVGGLNEELLFSARLDNLGMSFSSVEGFLQSLTKPNALDQEESIRLVALFDHEEIGSNTAQGADSNILPSVIRRLSVLSADDAGTTTYEQSLASSFLISADMAHSVHPNYASKHESEHKPEMNKGVVIKINANARYASNSPGKVLIQEVATKAKVPLQAFVVRNDSSCGSTIGPMLSASLGTRTIDLGCAQLSMHSIRETGGVYDVDYAIKLFESFFVHFSTLSKTIIVD